MQRGSLTAELIHTVTTVVATTSASSSATRPASLHECNDDCIVTYAHQCFVDSNYCYAFCSNFECYTISNDVTNVVCFAASFPGTFERPIYLAIDGSITEAGERTNGQTVAHAQFHAYAHSYRDTGEPICYRCRFRSGKLTDLRSCSQATLATLHRSCSAASKLSFNASSGRRVLPTLHASRYLLDMRAVAQGVYETYLPTTKRSMSGFCVPCCAYSANRRPTNRAPDAPMHPTHTGADDHKSRPPSPLMRRTRARPLRHACRRAESRDGEAAHCAWTNPPSWCESPGRS